MSISYNKSIPVVFLVQEGDDLPREATEEDFLKAGYVPATDDSPSSDPAGDSTPAERAEESGKKCKSDSCIFPIKDHIHIDLTSPISEETENLYQDILKDGVPDPLKDLAEKLGRGDFKIYNLSDVTEGAESGLYDPLRPTPAEKDDSKTEEKPSLVEEIAGDLFNGAFNVFNSVKSGLADLLEPIDYSETTKPSEEAKSAPKKEKETPEFSEFETSVIDMFAEAGYGKEAIDAMRKSKEFSSFLMTNKPSAEQARKFAEMLKNGKPPFFG